MPIKLLDFEMNGLIRNVRSLKVKLERLSVNSDAHNWPVTEILYCNLKKQYKKSSSKKEAEHKLKRRNVLESNINDSRKFWNNIETFSRRNRKVGNISDDQWLVHFKIFFDVNSDELESDEVSAHHSVAAGENDIQDSDTMNGDITQQEVLDSIRNLKGNKAAGPDGIIPEVFKHSGDKRVPFLVKLFNKIFSVDQYPEAWSEALIQPFHKQGDVHMPDNYSGISLFNICSKVYSYIINKRLCKWVKNKDILGEIQAGFRKDHSTINHVFCYLILYDSKTSKK